MNTPRRPIPPSAKARAVRRPAMPPAGVPSGRAPAKKSQKPEPEPPHNSSSAPSGEDMPPTPEGLQGESSQGLRERIRKLRRRESTEEVATPEADRGLTNITSPGNKAAAVYQTTRPLPVSSLTDRRKEISRENWRAGWRKFGIGAGIAALVAAIIYVTIGSPLLALNADEISISGEGIDIDREGVQTAIDQYVGTPLVLLDPTEVAGEVSEVSGVKSVTVRREWPQGLSVAITPREAVANIAMGEGFTAVDTQGMRLAQLDEPREGIPLVEIPLDDPQTESALQAVLTVLGSLDADLLELTAVGEADHGQWVKLRLHDGATVVWGTPEENDIKGAVLKTLLQVEANEYDVASPLAPVTR